MSLSFPFRRAGLGVALSLLAGAGVADPSFPPRKAGLWEMRIAGGEAQGTVMQHCVDAATDKALQDFGKRQPKMNRKFCKEELRSEVGRLLVHQEVCTQSTQTVTTRVVITGDFNSQYRVQSVTTYDPPRKAADTQDMVMEARWVGACAAGQKPGDMIMPGGMKMNVMQMVGGGRGK